MEILPVVVGQAVGLGARRQLVVEGTVSPCIDLRQVAEIEQAAAQELGRLRAQGARGGKQAGRDIPPFLPEHCTHLGGQLGAARRRPDGKIGLGHGLHQAAAGGIVAGIPGDPGGLAGGVGEAVEGGNHGMLFSLRL